MRSSVFGNEREIVANFLIVAPEDIVGVLNAANAAELQLDACESIFARIVDEVFELHTIEAGRNERAVFDNGLVAPQILDDLDEPLVGQHRSVDHVIDLADGNVVLIGQVILRDERAGTSQQQFPFFADGQNADPQFADRAGVGQRQ